MVRSAGGGDGGPTKPPPELELPRENEGAPPAARPPEGQQSAPIGGSLSSTALTAEITNAISTAQQAIQADVDGKPELAISLYGVTVMKLRELTPSLMTDVQAATVAQYIQAYEERGTKIRHNPEVCGSGSLAQRVSKCPPVPPFPLDDLTPPPRLEPLPVSDASCFELMHRLYSTLVSGGWVSPNVYVPKIVWYQELGLSQLCGVRVKIRFAEELGEYLSELEKASGQPSAQFLKALDAYRERQASLYTRMGPSIQAATGRKGGMGKLWDKGAKMMTGSLGGKKNQPSEGEYIPILITLFSQCEFLKGLVEKYESEPEVSSRLHDVSAFLFSTVVNFALQDLYLLLELYNKTQRNILTKMPPKSFEARP